MRASGGAERRRRRTRREGGQNNEKDIYMPSPFMHHIPHEKGGTQMEICIALFVLMGLTVIRQDDMAAIREIEEEQMNAPRKRRRLSYVDHHA